MVQTKLTFETSAIVTLETIGPYWAVLTAQRNVTQVRNTNWFQNSVLISWQELRSWTRMPKKCPKDWTNIASVKSIPCDCSSNDCFPSQPLLQKIKDETFWLKPQILWEMLSIWLHFYQRRRLSSAAYLEKTRNILENVQWDLIFPFKPAAITPHPLNFNSHC